MTDLEALVVAAYVFADDYLGPCPLRPAAGRPARAFAAYDGRKSHQAF